MTDRVVRVAALLKRLQGWALCQIGRHDWVSVNRALPNWEEGVWAKVPDCICSWECQRCWRAAWFGGFHFA